MPNSRLKIVGDEFLTSIDYHDEFHVNLFFDRSIYRPMCTHMSYRIIHDKFKSFTLRVAVAYYHYSIARNFIIINTTRYRYHKTNNKMNDLFIEM